MGKVDDPYHNDRNYPMLTAETKPRHSQVVRVVRENTSRPGVGFGRWFICNPVEVGGEEREGAPGVLTVDTSQTIEVLVIGDRVPNIGEDHIASWVASLNSWACQG